MFMNPIMRETTMNRQPLGRPGRLGMLGLVLLCATRVPAASAQTGDCRSPNRSAGAASREDPATVCRLLSALSADSMEGRATGSSGAHRAARLIAEQFRAAGLEPAGDSGYFQRVPLVRSQRPNGRSGFELAPSLAARDTFPEARRGSDVNVIGRLTGSDPKLKDSVVLVDAHFDHLGLARSPVDIDSMLAWQALAAPIRAERDAWFKSSGLAARADRGSYQLTDEERKTMSEFSSRIAALHVNMDSIRRVHPTPRRDSVFNGADDDASGVVAVMEIARRLAAGPRPKRTIIFMATTGEEVGLLGARWYMQHPVVPNDALVANLEIEMIGRPDSLSGGSGRAWLTGFERSTMGESFAAAGLPIVPDKRPSQSFFARSDNIAFARMGIPAHTLSSFNLHEDYHQVTDEVRAVDFEHMAAVIDAAVKAVGLLANGPAPVWKPGGKP
jgi:hypothetical protein